MSTTENKSRTSINKIIFVEWITTIAVFVSCFAYLSYKIEKQADRTDRIYETVTERTDRLYEMFIELIKENRAARP